MSYQQPPGSPPPGWYPDPYVPSALRWWDGTQWGSHTQPMPGMSPDPQPPYPPAAYAPDGYGAVQQERAGRHRMQTAPQDGTAATSAEPEPEPDPSQLQAQQDQRAASQQPYAPAPEPPKQPPQNTRNTTPRWITGVLAAIGAIAIVSFALSHTSSGGGPGSNTAATGAAPASQAAAPQPSCQDQAVSWKNNGGASDADAIEGDLSGIQKAATSFQTAANSGGDLSGAESALQSASASLQSDAQSAEADLPPACIPGVRRPYAQGLADYFKAAGDYQNSVSELGSGSDDVALGDVEAGTKAMNAGNGKINTAVTALKAFENG